MRDAETQAPALELRLILFIRQSSGNTVAVYDTGFSCAETPHPTLPYHPPPQMFREPIPHKRNMYSAKMLTHCLKNDKKWFYISLGVLIIITKYSLIASLTVSQSHHEATADFSLRSCSFIILFEML